VCTPNDCHRAHPIDTGCPRDAPGKRHHFFGDARFNLPGARLAAEWPESCLWPFREMAPQSNSTGQVTAPVSVRQRILSTVAAWILITAAGVTTVTIIKARLFPEKASGIVTQPASHASAAETIRDDVRAAQPATPEPPKIRVSAEIVSSRAVPSPPARPKPRVAQLAQSRPAAPAVSDPAPAREVTPGPPKIVDIRVTIDAGGKVVSAELITGNGAGQPFVDAALDMARHWQFEPAAFASRQAVLHFQEPAYH